MRFTYDGVTHDLPDGGRVLLQYGDIRYKEPGKSYMWAIINTSRAGVTCIGSVSDRCGFKLDSFGRIRRRHDR